MTYPTTQDADDHNFAVWDAAEALVLDILQVTGVVNCPVNLLFTDSQNRQSGIDFNGNFYFDIPDTFFMRIPDGEGGYEWFFRLSDEVDVYQMDVIGTGIGTFDLLTASGLSQEIYIYPQQSIGTGDVAEVTISGITPGPGIRLPDGTLIWPETQTLPNPELNDHLS